MRSSEVASSLPSSMDFSLMKRGAISDIASMKSSASSLQVTHGEHFVAELRRLYTMTGEDWLTHDIERYSDPAAYEKKCPLQR